MDGGYQGLGSEGTWQLERVCRDSIMVGGISITGQSWIFDAQSRSSSEEWKTGSVALVESVHLFNGVAADGLE